MSPRMNRGYPLPEWRGGLLPARLGGLLDPAIERIQGAMRPEQWDITQWPTFEQIQASAAQKGPVGWEQMAPLMDAVTPMAKIGGLLAHTVWHGSPHKWDVPDISKVGTGEGAQAYGHGFYSAESPEVARQYQETLAPGGKVAHSIDRINDALDLEEVIGQYVPSYVVDNAIKRAGKLGGVDEAISQIDELAPQLIKANNAFGDDMLLEKEVLKAYRDKIQVTDVNLGHLYKLDIPDEDIPKYLDWDKPLSEQADGVRETLKELLEYYQPSGSVVNANRETGYARWDQDLTGAQIRELLELKLGRGKVDKELEDAGIFGIRYLDGSSRGAGEGTYNYVTFDPSRIKVLERR